MRLRALWVWLLTLGWGIVGPATAQSPSDDTATSATQRPRVALVLSGGGARGFAHVGVLKALEAAHVPVDMVVGTSMGAIIGGLYAAGMGADELERHIMQVDWNGVFQQRPPRPSLPHRQKEEDFEFSPVLQLGFRDGEFRLPAGAISSRSLELLLRRHTLHTRHLNSFDQLPTAFRAVATDMETGTPVVLQSGDLAAALRASMSVPGVFAPLVWDGRVLGDGGLVNNLPVDVAHTLGADAVIAVNIGTPLAGRETLQSVVGVTLQMINILTEQNVRRSVEKLGKPDLLLAPPLGSKTSADFNRAHELVALGDHYAQTVRASLERFAVPEPDYTAWRAQRQRAVQALHQQTPSELAFVRIEGAPPSRLPTLEQRLEASPGLPLDPDTVERDVARLALSQDYQRIDYRLSSTSDQDREGLVYQLTENSHGRHQFRIGLALQTDFQGQGDFKLRLSHNLRWLTDRGTQWRNQLELGATTALRTELYHPFGLEHDRFTSAYADTEMRKVELFDAQGQPSALFRRRTSRIGLDAGWHLGTAGAWGDVRLGWVGSNRQSTPDFVNGVATQLFQPLTWNESALRLAVVTDQLDHANFPQSGHRFHFEVQSGTLFDSGRATPFARWESQLTGVTSAGPHTLNAHLRLAQTTHIPQGAQDEYSLGGFQQLSGYRIGQVAGNNLVLARLSYYRSIATPGIGRAFFAGGSFEMGNAWTERRDLSWQGVRTGSSLFLGMDTGIGPMYLSLVHAKRGHTGLYFLLGRP
jgi:NTE family protein